MMKPKTMSFYRHAVLFFLVLLDVLSSNAQASCKAQLNLSNINLIWSLQFSIQSLSLTVSKSKGDACDYYVTFSKGGSSSYARQISNGGTTLGYQLYADPSATRVLEDLPGATLTNVLSGHLDTGTTSQQLSYYLDIPFSGATSPTLKPSGTYTDSFTVSLYGDAFGSTSAPIDSAQVSVSVVVPKITELSLVSTGSAFDPNSTSQNIGLGVLTPGSTRSIDLKVRSNISFNVLMSSTNNGNLLQPQSNSKIPYVFAINGTNTNLVGSSSQPAMIASGTLPTSTDGMLFPLTFTVPDVTDKLAGTYSDTLTVTISAD